MPTRLLVVAVLAFALTLAAAGAGTLVWAELAPPSLLAHQPASLPSDALAGRAPAKRALRRNDAKGAPEVAPSKDGVPFPPWLVQRKGRGRS